MKIHKYQRTVFLLCPDESCNLFYDISRPIPCVSKCPRKAKRALTCPACFNLHVINHGMSELVNIACACGHKIIQLDHVDYKRVNFENKYDDY